MHKRRYCKTLKEKHSLSCSFMEHWDAFYGERRMRIFWTTSILLKGKPISLLSCQTVFKLRVSQQSERGINPMHTLICKIQAQGSLNVKNWGRVYAGMILPRALGQLDDLLWSLLDIFPWWYDYSGMEQKKVFSFLFTSIRRFGAQAIRHITFMKIYLMLLTLLKHNSMIHMTKM